MCDECCQIMTIQKSDRASDFGSWHLSTQRHPSASCEDLLERNWQDVPILVRNGAPINPDTNISILNTEIHHPSYPPKSWSDSATDGFFLLLHFSPLNRSPRLVRIIQDHVVILKPSTASCHITCSLLLMKKGKVYMAKLKRKNIGTQIASLPKVYQL